MIERYKRLDASKSITYIYYGSRPLRGPKGLASISESFTTQIERIDQAPDYSANLLHHAALKISCNDAADIYDFVQDRPERWYHRLFGMRRDPGKIRKNGEKSHCYHWEIRGAYLVSKRKATAIVEEVKKRYEQQYNLLTANCKDFVKDVIRRMDSDYGNEKIHLSTGATGDW